MSDAASRRVRLAGVPAAAFWATLFGFLSLLMLAVGAESALHFLGPPIDGPFQLYNSLRRIWVGQRAGVDFQFFHGIGVPYLHYPMFRLLGGTFFASELTRQLVSAILYPLTVLAFLKFFLKDWTRTLAWSAIVMVASIALRMTSVLVAVNSLLGIRSTLPVLFPIVICLPWRRGVRTTLAALTAGGALLLGTEQGLATLMALALAAVLTAIRDRRITEDLVDGAVIIAGSVATLVVALLMLGGPAGMRGALQYNFRLVPMDQYWYFGAPPNLFIAGWRDIPSKFALIPRVPVGLCVAGVFAALSVRRLWGTAGAERRRGFAFTIAMFYAMISCASLLGTYANAYVQPLLRTVLLVGAVYLADALPARDARLGRASRIGVSPSVLAVAGAALLAMVVIVPSMYGTIVVGLPHMVVDHLIHGEGQVFSGIWPATMPASQAILDSRRDSAGRPPSLWSTYSGLLEARNGLFNPSVDYIIHALGPKNRAEYVTDFERVKPRLVQTVDPEYTQYETWIEDTSWDFYASLLRNYEVIGATPWSFFWERRPRTLPSPPSVWAANVPPDSAALDLPVPPVAAGYAPYVLVQVEMDYETHNPLRSLPVIGASPRYLVRADGALQKDPVSLNPYLTRTRFPLLLVRGRDTRLTWKTFSLLPGASLRVTAVRLSIVPVTAANQAWLRSLADDESARMAEP